MDIGSPMMALSNPSFRRSSNAFRCLVFKTSICNSSPPFFHISHIFHNFFTYFSKNYYSTFVKIIQYFHKYHFIVIYFSILSIFQKLSWFTSTILSSRRNSMHKIQKRGKFQICEFKICLFFAVIFFYWYLICSLPRLLFHFHPAKNGSRKWLPFPFPPYSNHNAGYGTS